MKERATPLIVTPAVERQSLDAVVVHFAGDSGDGMQVTGAQFTATSALYGNDIQTFPDFPAEIRAPAGTIPGVSGFQLRFSDHSIHTPGDQVDVLIAMNPAAFSTALPSLKRGGLVIVDSDKFTDKDFKKAGLPGNPLDSEMLSAYTILSVPITHLTLSAVESLGLSRAQSRKCKNMFALGMMFWLFDRPLQHTLQWLADKFSKTPAVAEANQRALKGGYQYAISAELFEQHYTVSPAKLAPGTYRQMTGNQAVAWGCVAAAALSEVPVLLAGYPITPASDILHQVAQFSDHGVSTFQAEDEIAAVGAAIGAAYGGGLGVTCTSGPGLDLKMEAIGLAVMAELPLVIVDVQRAGPSTGLPTKTEQSDLLAAIYGRHGECPLPVLAPKTPGDAFNTMLKAFELAVRYMTPVIVLSDGYLANGSEAWKIPAVEHLPDLKPTFYEGPAEGFAPYKRNADLSRPWVRPGQTGLEHRIGGLEKAQETGAISYDPANHASMIEERAAKIQQLAQDAPLSFAGSDTGDLLVITWGSTYGAARSAVEGLQSAGVAVSLLCLTQVWPLPVALKEKMSAFKQTAVVELNRGQLAQLLRAQTLMPVVPITQVTGKPFKVEALIERLYCCLEGEGHVAD